MEPTHAPRKKRQSAHPRAADAGVVTLEMVARASGVSPSTVSRILNNTASVSAAKRQAVDAAIERLGFRPNPVARGLAGGRTFSIGVLTQFISSPFYGEALHGIEDALVVRCHEGARDRGCAGGALVDVLNHGPPGERDQRLARKSRGGIACGNDGPHLRTV